MRLCFIGDSHLACIKQAWDAGLAARFPADTITFFAAPGQGSGQLSVRDGTLGSEDAKVARTLSMTSGGHERIDGSYDAYALHGMHLCIQSALVYLREHRDTLSRQDFVTEPEFRGALQKEIESSIAIANLRKLREVTQAPTFVSPAPMAHSRFQPLRQRLMDFEIAAPLADLFDELCGLVCQSLDARFVPQPPRTRFAGGLATKAEYSLNAARFSARVQNVQTEDASHMNAQYGAEAGAALLEAMLAL